MALVLTMVGPAHAYVPSGVTPPNIDLLRSTFLGGSANDDARPVALTANGNVYVAGQSYSGNLPAMPGAHVTPEVA